MEAYLKTANFVRFKEVQPFIKQIAAKIFETPAHREKLERWLGKPFDEIEFTHEEAVKCRVMAGMSTDPSFAKHDQRRGCIEHAFPILPAMDFFATIDATVQLFDFYTDLLGRVAEMKPGFFDLMDQHVPSTNYIPWSLLDIGGQPLQPKCRAASIMSEVDERGKPKTADDVQADETHYFRFPINDLLMSLRCGLFAMYYSTDDEALHGRFVNSVVFDFLAERGWYCKYKGYVVSPEAHLQHPGADEIWSKERLSSMFQLFAPRCLNWADGVNVSTYLQRLGDSVGGQEKFADGIAKPDNVRMALGMPGLGFRLLDKSEDDKENKDDSKQTAEVNARKPDRFAVLHDYMNHRIIVESRDDLKKFDARYNAIWSMKWCPLFAEALKESGLADRIEQLFADSVVKTYNEIRFKAESRYLASPSIGNWLYYETYVNPGNNNNKKGLKDPNNSGKIPEFFDRDGNAVPLDKAFLRHPTSGKIVLHPSIVATRTRFREGVQVPIDEITVPAGAMAPSFEDEVEAYLALNGRRRPIV